MSLVINVTGLPAPQGSKRGFVVNGRVVMKESSAKVKPWRQDVVTAVEQTLNDPYVTAGPVPLTGPVDVRVDFYLPRPRYHFRTGARAHELKPNAPTYVDKKPDTDKLLRSTLDGLTSSGVIRDDAQVASLTGVKRYADAATGARITITPLDTVPAASPTQAASTVTSEQGVLL